MPVAAGGGLDPRTLWPNILEAVKNRRRFTWILLSQNAQVTGFDGTTLQVGFVNAGARDNFSSSGSEDVLRQALAELFNVQWKIEAIVDPSGGSAPPTGGTAGFGGGGGYAGAPAQQRPATPAPAASGPAADRSAGAPQSQNSPYGQQPSQQSQQSQQSSAAQPSQGGGHGSSSFQSQAQGSSHGPGQGQSRASVPRPQPVAPEDDMAEEDDPDLVESALSGHDLIVRELGATVLEETSNQ